MSFSAAFENALALLLFQNANIANLGDATGVRGSSTAGSLYLSLHTANPGSGGTQSTSEATYPGYTRVAVARSSSGWDVSGAVANLHALTSFPTSTGTPTETETYAGVGVASSGAGVLLASAALSASIPVNAAGVTPQLTTATTFTMQ